MIDVKTLRQGNKLIANGVYKGVIKTFERFNDKLDVVFFSDGSHHGIGEFLKDCQPIPFTQEWAERFGLINKFVNNIGIQKANSINHEYDLVIKIWESEEDFEKEVFAIICPIYYVHQCQNIFMDLVGKELK